MSNFTLFLNIRKEVNKLFAMNHLEKKFCNAFEECTLEVAFCALFVFFVKQYQINAIFIKTRYGSKNS